MRRMGLPGQSPEELFPTKWHREHQIVGVKADLLQVAGSSLGAVVLDFHSQWAQD